MLLLGSIWKEGLKRLKNSKLKWCGGRKSIVLDSKEKYNISVLKPRDFSNKYFSFINEIFKAKGNKRKHIIANVSGEKWMREQGFRGTNLHTVNFNECSDLTEEQFVQLNKRIAKSNEHNRKGSAIDYRKIELKKMGIIPEEIDFQAEENKRCEILKVSSQLDHYPPMTQKQFDKMVKGTFGDNSLCKD